MLKSLRVKSKTNFCSIYQNCKIESAKNMFWEKCYGIVATFLKRKKCRTFITWTNLGAGGKRKLYKINGHWPLRVGEGQAKSVKDCTKTLLLIFHCWYLCSFTERKIIFRYKNLTHKKKTFFVLPDFVTFYW